MRFSKRTRILAVLAAVLLALVLWPASRPPSGEDLPELPPIDPQEVTRIVFEKAGRTIVLSAAEGGWRLVSPLEAAADEPSVRALLSTFDEPVPLDLRVGEGDHEQYGVDDNNGVLFEVFTGETEPVLSMVVGKDVPGGSTLLRLSGSDDVYRARIGRRYRYDREPTDWRNRTVLEFDAAELEAIHIRQPEGLLTFRRDPTGETTERGAPVFTDWVLEQDPAFPVDQELLQELARSLGRLRAGQVHAPDYSAGWDRPDAEVELTLTDGSTHLLVVVEAEQRAGLVRVDEAPDVYRVAWSRVGLLTRPRLAYRDRTLFSFETSDIDTLFLEVNDNRVRMRQDLATGTWQIIEPVNVDTDVQRARYAARHLAALRADTVHGDVDAEQAGLREPRFRLGAELLDGSRRVLEVGSIWTDSAGVRQVYLRRAGSDRVASMENERLNRITRAFLRE